MNFFRKKKEKRSDKPALSPEQKARRKKKIRTASVSAAGLAFALAAVILLNLVAMQLTDRFGLTLDLTANQIYDISDDSEQMLQNMEQPVHVTVLMKEDDFKNDAYFSKVYILLQKYRNLAGDRLSVEYIDPYTNPNAVNQYSDLSATIQEGSVIFSYNDNTRVLNTADFYATESDSSGYTYVTGFQGEQALTSAIATVTNDATPAAYIVLGHNEGISTMFSQTLINAGFSVDSLNLTESDIPEDASILVISLPQTDYTEDEVNRIDAFVKAGGDLMVFDGTQSPTDLPVLYAYLEEWGASVQSNMVLDAQYNISDAPDILGQLTDSTINDALASRSDMVLVTPNSKSITAALDDSVTDRTVEALLESRSTSYAKVLTDETQYDSYDKAEGDADGPFTLATLSTYTGNDDGGQVFVCSTAPMMSDDLMSASSLLNQSFLSNVVSTLQPDVNVVTIEAKNLSAEPLVIGTTAQFLVFVVLIFIPIGLFACGIAVFIRRRRL